MHTIYHRYHVHWLHAGSKHAGQAALKLHILSKTKYPEQVQLLEQVKTISG